MTASGAVRHIVLFRVPDRERLPELTRLLHTMIELDGVDSLQVRNDLGFHPPAYQLLLITTHPDAAGLAKFRADPRHQVIIEQLVALSDARVSLDFAVDGNDL